MATVEEAQVNLDRIEEALGQSVLEVEFADGRRVKFSTFSELIQRWHFWAKKAGEEAGRQRLFSEFRKGVAP